VNALVVDDGHADLASADAGVGQHDPHGAAQPARIDRDASLQIGNVDGKHN
jgi:hypothetical protein